MNFEELVYAVWDLGAHIGWPGCYREDSDGSFFKETCGAVCLTYFYSDDS